MSHNQTRSEKNEAQSRKPSRSGSFGQKRSFSGGGGGTAPPPSSSTHSSSSSSGNRNFRKSGNNSQGGQSRVSTATVSLEPNSTASLAIQNGAHVQSPLHGMSDAPVSGVPAKPTDSSTSRSTRAVPRAPSQTAIGASDSIALTTPAKGDVTRAFPLQFGSISTGIVNGMQIPARTSSAPPNLDEQICDQARHGSSKAVPTLPIPSAPKQQQQPPRKDVGTVNQSNAGVSHPLSQAKRDVHAHGPSAPTATVTQKTSVLPIAGISMPMPFQQLPVPVKFGAPNAQIQSQGVTATSLHMPMPLPVGNSPQVQQQLFVPSIQSHPLQPQGMMHHQGQSIGFTPQMGHQLPPQLGNLGISVNPQFAQQQGGKFGGLRKPVKITHPETHEEVRLDKRKESYLDGGSASSRSHPNVPPQSQPVVSFTPSHQINYYSSIQPNSYNPTPIFFQSQASLPLTSTQMTPGSQASRYNYPVTQGPQPISFMGPSSLNSLSIKNGPPLQGIAEPSNLEHAKVVYSVASSAPSALVQVTLKPAVGSLGEKVGSSSVSVTSPVVSKGESPKLLRPPEETNSYLPQRDSDIGVESSGPQSRSVSEPSGSSPLSVTVKNSATVSATSVQILAPCTYSPAPAVLPEESGSIVINTEGRGRETVRRSDSTKDHQKKMNKKDLRNSQRQYLADASDSAGGSQLSSLKTSFEVVKQPEVMQSPASEVVGSSTSISSLVSQSLVHDSSFKDGICENGEGKAIPAPSDTSGVFESIQEPVPSDVFESIQEPVPSGVFESIQEPVPSGVFESIQEPVPSGVFKSIQEPVSGISAGCPDASVAVMDSLQGGEESTCESSNTSGVETVSDNLDDVDHAKQNGYSMQEWGKTELPEGPKQGVSNIETFIGSTSESKEGSKQIEHKDSNVRETTAGNESESVKAEQELNEIALGCISEVDRMMDNLVMSVTSSSESIDADTSPSGLASSTVSHDHKSSTIYASTDGDCIDSQEYAAMESGMLHQESASVPTTVSSEMTWKVEGRSAENTSGGPVSTSVSAIKDKRTSESSKAKNITASGKKKRKEILKIADAAGTTSDLYMAYKGPEEKHNTAVSSESVDNSPSIDVKQTPADDTENGVVAVEEDGQSKAEPDDWEDAADISTLKLKTSDSGKWVCGSSIRHDEDGNEVMGKKKYSRDFLLTLSEQCTDLPAGFERSDIADGLMSGPVGISHIVDCESYPNSGRVVDRKTGGSRPERRGGVMGDDDKWSKSPGSFASGRDPRIEIGQGSPVTGFRPGQGGSVLRNPRGPPQYVGGILSGPMQPLAPHGGVLRNNHDADWWQRATGIQKGMIHSPQTPSQVMHKAGKKYEVGKVSDKEELKQRQLKAILNKLTPQNFDKLFEQVKDVNIDNAVTLSGVISQIFDKALTEPTFCEMYANFCYHLANELPDFSEDNEKITFKRLLLNKCQEEFEKGEREQEEANRVEEEGEIKQSEEEREKKKVQARKRMLGNIRLIGELYKKKMLTERIMHECIKKLLGYDSQYQNPDEEDIEALCKLMSTIGEMIDHPKAKEHMDAYFEMMTKLSNNMKLSSRVRFMLKDAIDLRKNKWQQRRKVEGPKKIEEVHRDAAQERQAQTSRLARGPGSSSSARRGQPMDFGVRGTAALSSPIAQMGSFRGLPPQTRGTGVQDIRLEDRHPYDRTLAVPLPQRPIDDDSITLGPQGGLARGMSIRGQPLMSSIPLADVSPSPGDSRRMPAGPNGYNSVSEWTSYTSREERMPRYIPERFMGPPAYDQSNLQERNTFFGSRDIRNVDHSFDRSMATSPATRMQGSSALEQNVPSDKVWPEERLRDMSTAAIREFYSAKDEKEVALCITDLNSPSFHPSMISIWVTDSFERKAMDRDHLAKLLVNLTKSQDSLLNRVQLMKGFESVLATLEEAVTDAPKAAEFLGCILARVIIEDVVPLREIGQLILEGGDEPGHLLQIGLGSEVLGSILESIRLEKGESVLNEIRASSNLRLEDFRPPNSIGSRKLDAFI